MEYLFGKEASEKIKLEVKNEVELLKSKPCLAVILNRYDEASKIYIQAQQRNAEQLGIKYILFDLEPSEEEYIKTIHKLNNDKKISAIMVTRPLFDGADESKILSQIDPNKDVDAMNAMTLGFILTNRKNSLAPATAESIMELLAYYNIEVSGKKVLVIGRSITVGKPVALMLLNKNATVTIAHTRTQNMEELMIDSDIIIVAIGKAEAINSAKMKKGVIVIDAGINYVDNKIVGDVKASEVPSLISKVPGGIGTLTSACLMRNVLKCYRKIKENE